MSESTQYSQACLQEGISNLRQAQSRLNDLLTTLKGELQSSLGAWEDTARSAYTEVQAQWDASAARQAEIINGMSRLLGQIAEGYDATEARNTGIWS